MAIMSFIEEVKELNTLLEIYMSDNNKQARAASDSSSKRGRLDTGQDHQLSGVLE